MDGGPSHMVPGSQKGDRPVAWTTDDKALWIFRRYEVPLQIVRLDIATGNRQNWRTLGPTDGTGVYLHHTSSPSRRQGTRTPTATGGCCRSCTKSAA